MQQLGRILHPTDLSHSGEVAFLHALKIALAAHAKLRILHVAAEIEGVHREDFPGVRDTLARWGVLPPGSPPQRVAEIGLDVRKIKLAGDDPVAAVSEVLAHRPVDLIVLATRRGERSGRPVAEALARRARVPALFLPEGSSGFVDSQSGAVALRQVIVCVDSDPDPHSAVGLLATVLHLLDSAGATVTLFYCGDDDDMPEVAVPDDDQIWESESRQGDTVEAILDCAREREADLIVMTTRGHDGFMDALRGSTTERVLRRARCPVLAVPAV